MKIYKLNCLVYVHKYKSMKQVAPGNGKREGFWEGKKQQVKIVSTHTDSATET